MLLEVVGRANSGTTTARLLVVLCLSVYANFCNGVPGKEVAKGNTSHDSSSDESVETCARCDAQFLTFFGNMSVNFRGITKESVNKSDLEVGFLHCRNLITAAYCYNDCNDGSGQKYTSDAAQVSNACFDLCNDPSCNPSFFMGCYSDHGAILFSRLSYSTTGCDARKCTTSNSISQCIEYYGSIQNCTGTCTPGQRAFQYTKFAQEIACRIPPTSAACNVAVQACILQTYGILGTNFMTGQSFTAAPSSVSCSFGRRFSECMTKTVSGTAALRDAPCYAHAEDIEHIIVRNNAIFKPFCDHPLASFTSICGTKVYEPRRLCQEGE